MQRKRRFTTLKMAREFDAQQKLDPETQTANAGRMLTVDAMMATWLATKAGLPGLKTADVYATDKREVLLTFSGVLAGRISPTDVRLWVARDRGQSLRERSLRALRQAYQLAIADGLLKTDPTAGIKRPPAQHADVQFLSWPQMHALAAASGDDPLIWLLGTTGLRLGEAMGLKVGDVRGTRLRVSRQVTMTSKGPKEGPPKHGKSRDVPVTEDVLERLPLAGREPDEWLFPNSHGGPLDQHNWRARVFKPAAQAAGLKGFHAHLLRHTAASLAIASGADVGGVQRMLGHANAVMTLNVYRHLFEDHLDDVAQRMNEASRAARA
jgi:integrase